VVDGGMVASDWTMQRLNDILGAPVDRPTIPETLAGPTLAQRMNLAAILIHYPPVVAHRQPLEISPRNH
jgi:glycerol kinase